MVNNKISLTAIFVFLMLVFYLTNITLDGWSLISFVLFYFLFIKFVLDLGSEISIRHIIAIIAVLQYLVGASLGYQYDAFIADIFRMAVVRDTYFSFVLPATIAYLIGLYFPVERYKKETIIKESSFYRSKGVLLIIVGFIAEFMPFLGFAGYLLAGLKYVGAFYLFASPGKPKYYWIALVFGYLFFVKTLSSGMFHEFILWGSFLVMMYYVLNPGTFWNRLTTISLGFLAIFLIQLVKPDFRALQARSGIQENRIALFTEVLKNKIYGDELWFSPKTTASNVVRLNQGWIVAKVMHNIPANRPFANGESINESITASLLPRFISPDKAIAGGRLNMQRYAGITLNKNTSMDIGQVGEAYANYGVGGGIVFMLILGFVFNLMLAFISRKSIDISDLIFWLPLLFLQVVKAETSLLTTLNHLVKASLLTWFFFSPLGKNLIERGIRIVDSFSKRQY
ncbi:MAG: hypothetical protein NTY07_16280 [Bacteroidia bacterium]|nr:hypothetical protein [Bacteroidia bacterium]